MQHFENGAEIRGIFIVFLRKYFLLKMKTEKLKAREIFTRTNPSRARGAKRGLEMEIRENIHRQREAF